MWRAESSPTIWASTIVQFFAVGDAVDQRKVAVADFGPVHAVHVAVVEIVALEAPGVEEHAAEFGAGVGENRPAGHIDFGFAVGLGIGKRGGFGVGVEDQEIIVFPEQDFLAVGGDFVGFDVGEDGFGRVAFVGDVHALQGALRRRCFVAVEPAEALFGGLQSGIVTGGNGDFVQAGGDVGEVDVYGGRGFFFVTRLFLVGCFFVVRFFFALGVFLVFSFVGGLSVFFSVGFFRFVGMQFIHGRKRGAQAGRQREFVDFHGAIEIGIRLARAPGRADRGLQHAIGEEIEPFAVGAPGGVAAVVAIRGEHLNRAGVCVEDFDLVKGVVGGLDVGKPLAVGRPGEVGKIAVHGLGDHFVGFGFQVEQPELLILVAVGEPVAVGRGHTVPAEDFRVLAELLGLADAVGGIFPEFGFAAGGGEGDDGFSVGSVAGFAEADGGIAGDFDDASAGSGREGEDFAAGGENGGGAIGREVGHGEVVERLFDPVIAELVEIGNERDGDDGVLIGVEVEEPEVGAALIDDAAFGEGSGLDVESAVMRELLHVVALRVHGEDVHGAVAVGEEIDAGVPEHGIVRGAGVVGGEGNGFGAGIVAPDIFGGAALVALGGAALPGEASEE